MLKILSLNVVVDLITVSIVLQYSELIVLSFLGPREGFVVHELALAVGRTVFEGLALLALLAAPFLRVLVLPDVDVFEGPTIFLYFFEDVRCGHADLSLSLGIFAEQHLEIFFHVYGLVVVDVFLG